VAKVLAKKSKRRYFGLLNRVSGLLDEARRATVRVTNSILTATYWEIGRQIVEFEQVGESRAEYGEELLMQLSVDLTSRFGRGFSRSNLQYMRLFFQGWEIRQTASGKFTARTKCQTLSGEFENGESSTELAVPQTDGLHIDPSLANALELFPIPWSHYVRLMSVKDDAAREFYEDEAILAGWSVRQLDRMISTLHYERTLRSRNKAAMLLKGREPGPNDAVTVEETIRDCYLLEFLNLKDEYSEAELEEAIIRHLEAFLLEMGAGFTFVARQYLIRIDGEPFRMDLVLFQRVLRCLVIIDLKIGKFTHADAGQMNLYLNYAEENMMVAGENPPVGLILCSDKSDAVVRYAMGGINAKVFAAKYLTNLPDTELLRKELLRTKHALETHAIVRPKRKK